MSVKMCSAYSERQLAESVVMTPCPRKARKGNNRFCREHERAYREILTGIILLGVKDDATGHSTTKSYYRRA